MFPNSWQLVYCFVAILVLASYVGSHRVIEPVTLQCLHRCSFNMLTLPYKQHSNPKTFLGLYPYFSIVSSCKAHSNFKVFNPVRITTTPKAIIPSHTKMPSSPIPPFRTMTHHISSWVLRNSSTVNAHLRNFNYAWQVILDWDEGGENLNRIIDTAVANAHDILVYMERLRRHVDELNGLCQSYDAMGMGGEGEGRGGLVRQPYWHDEREREFERRERQ
jgi:hypothetical protein